MKTIVIYLDKCNTSNLKVKTLIYSKVLTSSEIIERINLLPYAELITYHYTNYITII